jgi:TolB protein
MVAMEVGMKRQSRSRLAAAFVVLGSLVWVLPKTSPSQTASNSMGIFEQQSDIGDLSVPGTAVYDTASGSYNLTSTGANIWASADDFHFLWKKTSGDVSLTADIDFPVKTGNPPIHRKAVLMFRQSLDAGASYVDAALHGSGMTALQYRRMEGGISQGIEINLAAPERVRLEKRGDVVTLFVSMSGEPLHPIGASTKLHLEGQFYVGLGLCAHSATGVEKATFSKVELKPLPALTSAGTTLYSSLQTLPIDPGSRRGTMIYTAENRFEAPNWTTDGSSLVFDQNGKIMVVPVAGGTPKALEVGDATRCNGSHGFSPDGKWLAISCAMPDKPESRVYIVPAGGGAPRLLTEHANSYWHSWSPDGKTIFFTRPGNGFNIYSIAVEGGEEKLLTSGSGINDDPDCSPDGKFVYFHSDRSGSLQIWRMHPDGSNPEQVTFDDLRNRTPHISPDGKSMVMLSYGKDVTGGFINKNVILRVMSLADNKTWSIDEIVGGGGTMNVPSWSPDSKNVAFVSYQDVPTEDSQSSR